MYDRFKKTELYRSVEPNGAAPAVAGIGCAFSGSIFLSLCDIYDYTIIHLSLPDLYIYTK